MFGNVLATKTLDDGSFVIAIDYGSSMVVLMHQRVVSMEIAHYTPNPHRHQQWDGKNGLHANIRQVTIKTELISREDFDKGNYERHIQDHPEIAQTLRLEDHR